MSFADLLSGYDIFSDVLLVHPSFFSDSITAGFLPSIFNQFLTSSYVVFEFLLYAFVICFLWLLFFGIFYLIVNPLFKRISKIV